MIRLIFNFFYQFVCLGLVPFHQPIHNDSGGTPGAGAGPGVGPGVGGGTGKGLQNVNQSLGRRSPRGWFHRAAQQEEEELVTKGLVKQFYLIQIPANAPTGLYAGSPINVSGNGLQLMRNMGLGNPPVAVAGSGTARIAVRLNNESAPWIPMSFISANNDAQYIGASIGKIWISVLTADASNPIFLLIVNNAGVSTPDSDSASSYSVPAGAQGPE